MAAKQSLGLFASVRPSPMTEARSGRHLRRRLCLSKNSVLKRGLTPVVKCDRLSVIDNYSHSPDQRTFGFQVLLHSISLEISDLTLAKR